MPILSDQRGVAPILFVVIGLLVLVGAGFTGFVLVNKPSVSPSPTPVVKVEPSPSVVPSASISIMTPRPTLKPSTPPVTSPVPSSSTAPNTTATTIPSTTPQVSSTQTPTPTPSPSPSPSVSSSTITVSTNFVSVTLKKSDAQSGLIYGSGFSITSQGAEGFQVKYTVPTQGIGFYESSGGLTNGATSNIRSYVNSSKANGTYDGMAIIQYQKNNTWYDGPVVAYSITLTD